MFYIHSNEFNELINCYQWITREFLVSYTDIRWSFVYTSRLRTEIFYLLSMYCFTRSVNVKDK